MGKGLIADDHPLCVSAARSMYVCSKYLSTVIVRNVVLCICITTLKFRALKEADVIVLLGARLNWMLHFGIPPRFSSTVKFIQVITVVDKQIHNVVTATVMKVDVCPEEMGNNVISRSIMLVGDMKAVVRQVIVQTY